MIPRPKEKNDSIFTVTPTQPQKKLYCHVLSCVFTAMYLATDLLSHMYTHARTHTHTLAAEETP